MPPCATSGCLTLLQLQRSHHGSPSLFDRRRFTLLPHDSFTFVHRPISDFSHHSRSEWGRIRLHCSHRLLYACRFCSFVSLPHAHVEGGCYFVHTAHNAVQLPARADAQAVPWLRKSNCSASRRPHFAPSEAFVSRGGQRAAVRPALVARAQLSKGRWADGSEQSGARFTHDNLYLPRRRERGAMSVKFRQSAKRFWHESTAVAVGKAPAQWRDRRGRSQCSAVTTGGNGAQAVAPITGPSPGGEGPRRNRQQPAEGPYRRRGMSQRPRTRAPTHPAGGAEAV